MPFWAHPVWDPRGWGIPGLQGPRGPGLGLARAGPGPRGPGLGPGRRPLGILYLFRLQLKRGLFSYYLLSICLSNLCKFK